MDNHITFEYKLQPVWDVLNVIHGKMAKTFYGENKRLTAVAEITAIFRNKNY